MTDALHSPRVSVLIPCYNAGAYLGQALQSVLEQTYRDFEIIVVDDGSTDDSAAVAKSFACVRYIHKAHSGISATRNLAVQEARGEFVAFLDADDLWAPEKLALQVAYLDSHPQCQMVHSHAKNFFDGPPETMTERQKQLMDANLQNYMASSCIRRALFQQHGVFREDYSVGEDTHWIARLRAAGVDMSHCIAEPLYFRRIHQNNISLTHNRIGRKDMMALLADAIRQRNKESKG